MPACGPLHGVRVLDLSRIVAGPFCTMTLGDLGADVIKVERPGSGDDTRQWGPPFVGGESAYYLAMNRNKRSIAVDFATVEGKEVVEALARDCDVLVENFRPGTLDRYGLGYDALARINPRLVHCSISGFGSSGPDWDRAGLDVVVSAVGGLLDITGDTHGAPVKPGVALVDIATSLYAVSAITAALHARCGTGRGQRIEVSLLGTTISALSNIAMSYLVGGQTPQRWGTAHPSIVPYEAFRAADGYLVIGVTNDATWSRFCAAVGIPADVAAAPGFASNAERVENRDAVVDLVTGIVARRSRAHWVGVLRSAGVPCGAVNSIDEVFADEQVAHLGIRQEVEHPSLGTMPILGSPIRLSDTPAAIRRPPPLLGEHTEEILRELGARADGAPTR